jgi:hypothetical protein
MQNRRVSSYYVLSLTSLGTLPSSIQPSRDDHLPGMPRFVSYRHAKKFLNVHDVATWFIQTCVTERRDGPTKGGA